MKTKIGFAAVLFFVVSVYVFPQTKEVYADKSNSTITYRLSHPLHEVESTSKNVDCLIDIDKSTKEISEVKVQVYVTTFNSGNSNRDSHAMEVIDALDYPDAEFVSSSVKSNDDSLKVYGKLTFHGITKDIVISAIKKLDGNKLLVKGNFDISLTEFKIERPSLLLIPVSDDLKFSFVENFNL